MFLRLVVCMCAYARSCVCVCVHAWVEEYKCLCMYVCICMGSFGVWLCGEVDEWMVRSMGLFVCFFAGS